MKPAIFHPDTLAVIQAFPKGVKKELGKAILDLQKGETLKMPLSKPMASVAPGVEELRIRDRSGSYRAFYFCEVGERRVDFSRFCQKKPTDSTSRSSAGEKATEGDAP
jgi:phage-related protein